MIVGMTPLRAFLPGAATLALLATLPLAAQEPEEPDGGALYADGFESGNTLAWTTRVPALPLPDAFRVLDLDLRDPHVFIDIPVFGCVDFTDDDLPAGLGPSFNDSLQTALETDGDGDGFLDFSFILGFRPFAETAADERIDAGCGLCTDPPAATTCDWDRAFAIPRTTTYDGITAGVCLDALPGTTSGYSPAVAGTVAPCVRTDIGLVPIIVLVVEGIAIVLEEGQIAGTLVGDPVFRLEGGLVRGFLSEAVANTIMLPSPLGDIPLSSLLPGGQGNCAAGDDRDLLEDVSGWWFYLEHVAEEVNFIGD
jgi:hypothetical protein